MPVRWSRLCTGILISPSIAYIIIGLVLGISASTLFLAALILSLAILLMTDILIAVGGVMETTPNIVILAPILKPLADNIGMNEIQFCIMLITALGRGFTTPPLGLNLSVLALDHELFRQTLKVAKTLLSEGGEIIALHVYETPQGSVSAYLDKEVVEAGFKAAENKLREKIDGLENVTPILVKGHSARTIVDVSNEHGVDCSVIGAGNPALSDLFFGTTVSRIARHATCAVHIKR